MTQDQLNVRDVRALFRLLGELRELGGDPPAWRRHLVASLAELCGARAVLSGELDVSGGIDRESAPVVHAETYGIGQGEVATFDDVVWSTHGLNDAFGEVKPASPGPVVTVARGQLIEDRAWYRTAVANDTFRAVDCDDFAVALMPVPALRIISVIKMFSSWRQGRFDDRERLLLEIVSEELARDWARAAAPVASGVPLAPRERQVLSLLCAGESEKQIAAALDISGHTTHQYVRSLYRAFKVHSRAELLAIVGQAGPRRALLASELPGFRPRTRRAGGAARAL